MKILYLFKLRPIVVALIVVSCFALFVGYKTIRSRSEDSLMLQALLELEKSLADIGDPYIADSSDCHFIDPRGEIGVFKVVGCTVVLKSRRKFDFAVTFDHLGKINYVQGD